MVTVKKKGDMEKMNITQFTNEILRRGGEITNDGYGQRGEIQVYMRGSRFNLLQGENVIGVAGYMGGDWHIRTCYTLGEVLGLILGYA